MPFGLTNGPATFQRVMERILKKKLYKGVVVYLDDVIIYGDDLELNIKEVQDVKALLKENGFSLNEEKCQYHRKEAKILGHIIKQGINKPDLERIKSIRNLKEPKNRIELQQWLGIITYCRMFLKDVSIISKPLYSY